MEELENGDETSAAQTQSKDDWQCVWGSVFPPCLGSRQGRGGFRGKPLYESFPLLKVAATKENGDQTHVNFLIHQFMAHRMGLYLEGKCALYGEEHSQDACQQDLRRRYLNPNPFMGHFRTHLAHQTLIQHLSRSPDCSLGSIFLLVMIQAIHTHLQSVPASLLLLPQ